MLSQPGLPTVAHSKKIVEIRFVRDADLWHWLVIDEFDRLYLDHGQFRSLDLAADNLRSVEGFG